MVAAVAPDLEREEIEQPLELSSLIDVDQLPPHYPEILDRLGEVSRFCVPEYPDGFIVDDAKRHTLRCLSLINNEGFMVSASVKTICSRVLLLHDFPESIVNDHPIEIEELPDKYEEREMQVAKEMLTPKDFALFRTFKEAELFLRGDLEDYSISSFSARAVFFAKLIDTIEGNLYFHESLINWVRQGNRALPTEVSMAHTFRQFIDYSIKIRALKTTSRDQEGFIRLLVAQLEVIRDMWGSDPMPCTISEGFEAVDRFLLTDQYGI